MLAKLYTSKEIQDIIKKHNNELNTCYTLCFKQNERSFHLQEFKGGKKLTQKETKELLLRDFFYQNNPNYWHLFHDNTSNTYILVWEM